MARMRSLKPEFFADEELGTCTSRDERLLYAGLWGLADEHSRLRGNPSFIKGQIFPYDDDLSDSDVDKMLGTLEKLGKLVRYQVGRSNYIVLKNLAKHQRLDADKVPSRLPAPPESAVPIQSGNVPDEDVPIGESPALSRQHVAGSMKHAAGRARDKPIADEPTLQVIVDHTDATPEEAAAVAVLVKAQRGPRSLPALIRRLASDDDLGQFLDQVRSVQRSAAVSVHLQAARDGPDCPHGSPGGEALHPETQEPLCPLCRRDLRKAQEQS